MKRDLGTYIKDMSLEDFRKVINKVAGCREFSTAFNRGVDNISKEQRDILEDLFAQIGVEKPIADYEMKVLISAISKRAVTYK